MVLTLFKNGFHLLPIAPKSQKRRRLGLRPREAKENTFGPCQFDTPIVENDVKAIQKWVPFTPICSQKRWRLGPRPRPSIARESGRAPSAFASLTQKIENGVNTSKIASIYSQLLPSPKSVSGCMGLRPIPPIARESAFALASLTRRK